MEVKIMSNKKYELINYNPKTSLYRIRALLDFGIVKAGDIGGWVSGEHNLSHEGNCWVFDNARVFDRAVVSDNAQVFDKASVSGNARVSGNDQIFANAVVCDDSAVKDALRGFSAGALNITMVGSTK
jgi:UDP-3-O-[3-hydroxymyristoyl] glucosamine N-acyltransferase